MDRGQSCTISDSTAFVAHKINSRTKRRAAIASAEVWHKRLGHPGPSALEHLVQRAEGVRIKGVPTVKCDACGRAKSKRRIRREARPNSEGPGKRIAIDFHDYEAQSFNKERSQMLVTDRYSGQRSGLLASKIRMYIGKRDRVIEHVTCESYVLAANGNE